MLKVLEINTHLFQILAISEQLGLEREVVVEQLCRKLTPDSLPFPLEGIASVSPVCC